MCRAPAAARPHARARAPIQPAPLRVLCRVPSASRRIFMGLRHTRAGCAEMTAYMKMRQGERGALLDPKFNPVLQAHKEL